MEIICKNMPREMDVEMLKGRLLDGQSGLFSVAASGPLHVEGKPARGRLLMAHGAGAGQDSGFLRALREALAQEDVQVLGFEFAYLRKMRTEGRRRPPPAMSTLVEEMSQWCDIVSHQDLPIPWLGGKSMGGRVASQLLAQAPDMGSGLILCGYPFHPPRKPHSTRLSHWPQLECPIQVIQGSRDPFGTREEVLSYDLPKQTAIHFLEEGNHDWRPTRRSGRLQHDLIEEAAKVIRDAIEGHTIRY